MWGGQYRYRYHSLRTIGCVQRPPWGPAVAAAAAAARTRAAEKRESACMAGGREDGQADRQHITVGRRVFIYMGPAQLGAVYGVILLNRRDGPCWN